LVEVEILRVPIGIGAFRKTSFESIPGAAWRRLGFFIFGGRKRRVHTEDAETEHRGHRERKEE